MMYDVAVVGARCAGSPTAMLLAQRGYRVLLVDRASFPSDVISAHCIGHQGIACLERWGLLDHITASNCPAIRKILIDLNPVARFTVNYETGIVDVGTFKIPFTPSTGVGSASYCVRRRFLDAVLLEAAITAGAEARENFAVEDLLWDNGTVTGIRGRTAGGTAVEERARLVIGADGRNSGVARKVGAEMYRHEKALTCAYHAYWSGVPSDAMEFYAREGRAIMVVPTNDGRTCVGVGWPHADFHAVRSNIEQSFLDALKLIPGLAERVAAGTREERYIGTADLPNFFRHSYGDGWALVGDAGHHKDPITGQGITDAFRHSNVLVDAVDRVFKGESSFADAMQQYQTRRDEISTPMYEVGCRLAALPRPSQEVMQLFIAFGKA